MSSTTLAISFARAFSSASSLPGLPFTWSTSSSSLSHIFSANDLPWCGGVYSVTRHLFQAGLNASDARKNERTHQHPARPVDRLSHVPPAKAAERQPAHEEQRAS